MSIKYITTGDERIARGLLGEGRHQLSILKNVMTFQNLQQLQRVVRFDGGKVIKCSSCFGQDVVNVYVPPEIPISKRVEVPIVEIAMAFFELKLIRSDSIEITEESELLKYLRICNSKQVALEIEKEYNVETGYWEVTLVNPERDIDRKGYFALYFCVCGYETQYPERILEADKWDEEDLIKPGRYECIIPSKCFYFRLVRDIDGLVITPETAPHLWIGWENTLGHSEECTLEYNSESQCYSFEIPTLELDPAGYWVSFGRLPCYSLSCQYPKRNRPKHRKKVEDLIQIGQYEAAIPYWRIMDSVNTDPDFEYMPSEEVNCENVSQTSHFYLGSPPDYEGDSRFSPRYYTSSLTSSKSGTVMSSVPYRILAKFNYGRGHGWIPGVGYIHAWGKYSGGTFLRWRESKDDPPEECCPNISEEIGCSRLGAMSVQVSGCGLSVDLDISKDADPEKLIDFSEGGITYAESGGTHTINITVTIGDSEFIDTCIEGHWDAEGNFTGQTEHEQTITITGEKITARHPLSAFLGINFSHDWYEG